MRIKLSTTPTEFARKYNLLKLEETQGCVCAEVRGGMHGLPQAGLSDYEDILFYLENHGCKHVKCAPGLWKDKK